jgi:hypothetical protein
MNGIDSAYQQSAVGSGYKTTFIHAGEPNACIDFEQRWSGAGLFSGSGALNLPLSHLPLSRLRVLDENNSRLPTG